MLGLMALTFIAYFGNYFAGGPEFGGRYWFLMIVPLAALTARAALADDAGLDQQYSTGMLTGLAALTLAAMLTFVPWRSVDKYWHYRGMRPGVAALAGARQMGRSLVMVRGREVPDYASAAPYNPLDPNAPVPVFVRRRDGATDSAVINSFHDRPVWLVAGPTVTGRSYEVEAGPLTASQALERMGARTAP
jgi:hypothetical protein